MSYSFYCIKNVQLTSNLSLLRSGGTIFKGSVIEKGSTVNGVKITETFGVENNIIIIEPCILKSGTIMTAGSSIIISETSLKYLQQDSFVDVSEYANFGCLPKSFHEMVRKYNESSPLRDETFMKVNALNEQIREMTSQYNTKKDNYQQRISQLQERNHQLTMQVSDFNHEDFSEIVNNEKELLKDIQSFKQEMMKKKEELKKLENVLLQVNGVFSLDNPNKVCKLKSILENNKSAAYDETMQTLKNSLDSVIVSLENELEQSNKIINDMTAQNKTDSKKIEMLEAKVSHYEKNTGHKDITCLLQNKVDLEAYKCGVESQMSELNKQLQILSYELTTKNSEVDTLQKQNTDMKKTLDSLHSEKNAALSKCEKLNRILIKTQQESKSTNEILHKDLEDLTFAYTNDLQKMEILNERLTTQEDIIKKLNNNTSYSDLNEKDRQNRETRNRLEDLIKQLNDKNIILHKEKEDISKKNTVLVAENKKLIVEIKLLQSDDLKIQNEYFKKTLVDLNNKNDILKSKNEALSSIKQNDETKITNGQLHMIEIELNQAKADNIQLKTKNDELLKMVCGIDDIITQLQTENEELKNTKHKHDCVRKDILDLSEAYSNLEEKNKQLYDTNEEFLNQLTFLKSKCEDLSTALQTSKKSLLDATNFNISGKVHDRIEHLLKIECDINNLFAQYKLKNITEDDLLSGADGLEIKKKTYLSEIKSLFDHFELMLKV